MVTGDLFNLGLPAVGHGCNCAGAMGAGIAVEFKRWFPAMYQQYRRRCQQGGLQLGDVFVWDRDPTSLRTTSLCSRYRDRRRP
jgi:O-acetyl-ADP-ribose deacetylase (regulator of RNase III)